MSEGIEGLLIGRLLAGRYRVEERIGRGGMSIVYRAGDERLGRPVALKIVAFPAAVGDAGRRNLRERLRREAAAAARIPPHANVVQIYDYGTDDDLDLDFIAMELLRGVDLKQALRDRRLGPREARRVLLEAARGVAAGHRAGVVHRDVKPANIFLIGENDLEGVKILDFGIAKALELGDEGDLTRHDGVPHSPNYASPEQLDASRTLTPASDVYQLGLVGYEMLAGERPFTQEERDRIRGGDRIPIPSRGTWLAVDPSLRGTIARALEPEPADRFPSAAEFAEALTSTDEDRTLFASTVPEDDEATVAMPPAVAPAAPPEVSRGVATRPLERRPAEPARPGDRRSGFGGQRTLIGAGVALAILAGALLLRSPGDDRSSDSAEAPAETDDVESLHEEFRPLLYRAFVNLRDAASADEGEEAAAAVQDVIVRIHESWVEGDLGRHLENYAERVAFRGARNADHERIASVRREDLERYPEREIVLSGIAIEFPEAGRARALVDRRWRFVGDEVWEGSARDELVLVREEGKWKVTEESELERFEERRTPRRSP